MKVSAPRVVGLSTHTAALDWKGSYCPSASPVGSGSLLGRLHLSVREPVAQGSRGALGRPHGPEEAAPGPVSALILTLSFVAHFFALSIVSPFRVDRAPPVTTRAPASSSPHLPGRRGRPPAGLLPPACLGQSSLPFAFNSRFLLALFSVP